MNTTSTTLLEEFRLGKREAVNTFATRYLPLLVVWASRFGLGEEDANEIAQRVILKLLRTKFLKYQRERGPFGVYLRTIVHNAVKDYWREQRKIGNLSAEQEAALVAHDGREAAELEEHRRALVALAWDRVRAELSERDQRIFERLWQGEKVASIVANLALSMTPNSVYQVLYRVRKRLTEEINGLDPTFFSIFSCKIVPQPEVPRMRAAIRRTNR